MTFKLNRLATAVTFAFATAAAAQTPPTTTQTTTTQTPPAAAQAPPATTTPATTQTTTPQTQPNVPQCQPATTPTTTQTTTTSKPGATDQPAATPAGQVTKATAADIKAGASVYDQTGALVGKVDKVVADGAIVNTGKARAQIPLSSFGKNDKGLVVSATKANLDAQAKKETKVETKPKS